MTTYYERRYKKSREHRHHASRRKIKKMKLTTIVLAVICLVIALGMLVVALFVTESMRHKWLLFGFGYAGGAMVLFIFRWLLTGYEKLTRTTRRRKEES